MTTIEIPGYVTVVEPTPDLPVHTLLQAAADLLGHNTDLPAPRMVSVSSCGQEIEMQFPGDPATFAAMAAWAQQFGGTVTAEPGADKDGKYVRCQTQFTIGAIPVKGYAYIEADTAST